MHKRRNERPIRRVNPSGKVVFVARWTDRRGHQSSAGTFPLKGPCRTPGGDCCAQHAIWTAYDLEARHAAPHRGNTVGAYVETWTERRPRSERSNETYNQRIGRILSLQIEGRPFGDWPMPFVRRRHLEELLDILLRVQGRSASGALGVVQVLSAMWEDAIRDEVAEANPCKGVRIRASDPRIRKAPREIRVFSWEEMYAFAAATGALRTGGATESVRDRWRAVYGEAMVRCLADCGLRLGELLGLYRIDVQPGVLHVRRTAYKGVVQAGTKTDHGKPRPGRKVPLPAELEEMLRRMPARLGSEVLFPTTRGNVWREGMFYQRIWKPTQRATGMDIRPHEMRHSWVSLLLERGANPLSLSRMAGHTPATMYARYAHSQGEAMDDVRAMVGGL